MKKLTITALLIIISLVSVAQEKLTPEEMFRWFPEGKYQSISHFEFDKVRSHPLVLKMKASNLYSIENYLVPLSFPLQDHLVGKIESMTILMDVRFVIYKGEEQRKSLRGGSHTSMDIGDEVYRTNSTGIKHYVLRFIDLNPILSGLVKEGLLNPTGKTIHDLPIYSFKNSDRRRQNIEYYAYSNSFNELLICEKYSQLEKMVLAGHGDISNLVDSFSFPEISDKLSEFGPCWFYSTAENAFEACMKQAEEDGVDPGVLQELRKRPKQVLPGLLLRYIFEKDNIVRWMGRLYADEKRAKRLLKNPKYKIAFDTVVYSETLTTQESIDRLLEKIKAARKKQKLTEQEKGK